MNHLLGVLFALGAATCWAIEPSIYVLGMKDTPPLLANAIRTSAAGVFSLIVVILWANFLGRLSFDRVQVVFLIAITFLGMGLGDWIYFTCLKHTEVSFVAGLVNTYPLFVALFTILFGTDKLTPIALLASIIIVSGVILVSKTKNSSETQLAMYSTHLPKSTLKKYRMTTALAILVAFTWGITLFGLGFSLQYFSPLSANAIRISAVGGLIFLAFLLPPSNNKATRPSTSSLTLLGIGGIFGLGIGSWMMLVSIKMLGTTRSSALLSVSPFFSVLIAILVLKEKPTLNRLGGILLVCLGVLLMLLS